MKKYLSNLKLYPQSIFLLFFLVIGFLLRTVGLHQFPPALYSDEVSQGYNAYSILRTGKDEHGTFLPIAIRSFGDWKPPLQTYLMIPTIKVFGLTSWGVRLPSAILGTFTILLVYLLTEELSKQVANQNNFYSKYLSLFAAFFMTFSPWHIHQSRSAMLIGVTAFFYALGILFTLKGFSKKTWYWIVAAISYVMAIYGYYGMRLVVPLTIILFTILFWKQIKEKYLSLIFPIFLSLLLLMPLGFAFAKNPAVVLGRVKTISIFHDQGVNLNIGELEKEDIDNNSYYLTAFFHNPWYSYVSEIVRRFFHHFDGHFLFLRGDTHPPFQIPDMGILYFSEGLLALIGFAYLLKVNKKIGTFVILLAAISILPAALTFITPAANRTFTLVIPMSISAALGIYTLSEKFKKQFKGILFLLAALYIVQSLYFVRAYFMVMPKQHANWWHYGYKELYAYLNAHDSDYSQFLVSAEASVPYIFYVYYNQISPDEAQRTIQRSSRIDEYGFEHVARIGKYRFPKKFNPQKDFEGLPKNSLIALTESEIKDISLPLKEKILYPNGKTAFYIFEANSI